MEYYALVIQKLQKELGLPLTSFPELKIQSLDSEQNPEWMSEETTGDEILQTLLKSDNEWREESSQ
jgi:hypothetical protein